MSGSNPDPDGMNMGIGPQVVVLICVFGAAAFVLLGYAATHYYFNKGPSESTALVGNEFDQVRYMREVRLRYKDEIANTGGAGRRWRDMNDAKRLAQARFSAGGESSFS